MSDIFTYDTLMVIWNSILTVLVALGVVKK